MTTAARHAGASARKPPPLVIPIFITHQGCPHRCIFCNQQPITSIMEASSQAITANDVAAEIEHWLHRSPRRGREIQVAFYGGSFTGMAIDRQQQLLAAVQPFLAAKKVDRIRLSTRPDYIDQDTAAFLQGYGVTIVEIGVQSMNQQVLDNSCRGHSAAQAAQAIRTMKQAGMLVGAQLMLGLPGETTRSAISGAQHLARLKPDFVRLYPALVLKGSGLERLFQTGRYLPQTLPRTIALAARLKSIFDRHHIPVVRIGLQPSPDLEKNLVAGPYHPSLGELVHSRLFFKRIRALAHAQPRPRIIRMAAADRSLFSGHKGCTADRLARLNILADIEIEFVQQQPRGSFEVL